MTKTMTNNNIEFINKYSIHNSDDQKNHHKLIEKFL
jgi:hypothetical protein